MGKVGDGKSGRGGMGPNWEKIKVKKERK